MITLNLFDYNFRQCECGTAHQTPTHTRYIRHQQAWGGYTLFTDGYVIDGTARRVESAVKYGWLHEPPTIIPGVYEKAPTVVGDFDAILTYYAPLLALDGFRFAPYGGVWIPRDKWGLRPKHRLVSMLIGEKMTAPGHRMRHDISRIIPDGAGVDFYGVRGEPVGYGSDTKLRVLADHMFSIICETSRDDNLFTEILLDCFAVGTIPIFWGADNIGDYFDDSGILVIRNAEDALYYLSCLSESLYKAMLPAAENNLGAIRQYRTTEDWMYNHGYFGVDNAQGL